MRQAASPSGGIPPGVRVLIVEDSTATRRILTALLREEFGMVVSEAPDGDQALAQLEQDVSALDLILSDISMPSINGYELCDRLRHADWYDGTPVVMVSTQSDAPSVIRVLKLGAEDPVPKPFDTAILGRVIGRVLAHA